MYVFYLLGMSSLPPFNLAALCTKYLYQYEHFKSYPHIHFQKKLLVLMDHGSHFDAILTL